MAYTAMSILQVLTSTSASAHLIIVHSQVQSSSRRFEIWVREGKIVNLSGCSQQDLPTRLSSPFPCILVEPLDPKSTPSEILFDINVLNNPASPTPPVGDIPTMKLPAIVASTPVVEHPEALKISSQLKRQTIDTAAASSSGEPLPEQTYRRLLFPARQAITVTLGRNPDCDITCANPTVSRKHCMLVFDGVMFTIHDLGSRNGTYLNKERIVTARAGRKALLSLGSDNYVLDWDD